MRIVLDTNVFVSSFFGGPPKEIIDLWKAGKVTLCLSGPIVAEYVEVLSRMGLRSENELQQLLSIFRTGVHTLFAGTTPSLQIVKKDPDDNRFVECAVELKAEFIVSGDKHLLQIKDYIGIGIVTSRQFLDAHAI